MGRLGLTLIGASSLSLTACDVIEDEARLSPDRPAQARDMSECTVLTFKEMSVVHEGEAMDLDGFTQWLAEQREAGEGRACLILGPHDDAPHGLVVEAYDAARTAGFAVIISRDYADE